MRPAAAPPPPPPDQAGQTPGQGGNAPDLRITRADVLCIGPLIAFSIYNLATLPIGPSLIGRNPVLLAALRGSQPALIASGAFARVGRASLWAALLAPVVLLVFDAPFWFWAGHRYGRRILDHYANQSPRWKRRVARGERAFARWGPWTVAFANFLPAPNALFYVAAGEARMSPWVFALAEAFATMSWIGIHVGLGWALGQRAVGYAQTVSRYGLWFTLALIVVVVVLSTRRAMRSSGEG